MWCRVGVQLLCEVIFQRVDGEPRCVNSGKSQVHSPGNAVRFSYRDISLPHIDREHYESSACKHCLDTESTPTEGWSRKVSFRGRSTDHEFKIVLKVNLSSYLQLV